MFDWLKTLMSPKVVWRVNPEAAYAAERAADREYVHELLDAKAREGTLPADVTERLSEMFG